MSFIQREIDKLSAELAKTEIDTPEHTALHAAQQALSWALEPHAYASPYGMLTGNVSDNSALIPSGDGPAE